MDFQLKYCLFVVQRGGWPIFIILVTRPRTASNICLNMFIVQVNSGDAFEEHKLVRVQYEPLACFALDRSSRQMNRSYRPL